MDDTVIWIDGKRLEFSGLISLFGRSSTTEIARAFTAAYVGAAASHASVRHRDFTRFLRWMAARAEAAPKSSEARFCEALREGTSALLTREVVYEVGEAWASRLRNLENFEVTSSRTIIGRKTLHESIVSCLRKLALLGLWPDPGKFLPISRGTIVGGNIPSLGELAKVSTPSKLVGVVKADYRDTDWREVITSNEIRLASLRSTCVAVLTDSLALWEKGQEILADDSIALPRTPDELLATLIAQGSHRYFRDPLTELKCQAVLIRYLGVVDVDRHHFGDLTHTRLGRAISWVGGGAQALSHLQGGLTALVAAHLIVMIDTAFNVTTCDQLAADPFVGSAQRGKIRLETVAAAKLRARGAIQEGELLGDGEVEVSRADGEMTGASAIHAWQKLSSRLRATAARNNQPEVERLWIAATAYSGGVQIRVPTSGAANHHFLELLKSLFDHPILGGLPIRRPMIRPTVLQLESARGDFEHRVAGRLAQHSQAKTTMRYLSRPWFKALLSTKMRHFLEAYEAGLLSSIAGTGTGIATDAKFASSLEHAVQTGLGFLCIAPRTHATLTPAREALDCTAIDRCANCSFRQFRPSQESIHDLVLFHASLIAAEEEFSSNNPRRWAEVWLDFRAICEVLLGRLRVGHHKRSLLQAEADVKRGLESGELRLVQLW